MYCDNTLSYDKIIKLNRKDSKIRSKEFEYASNRYPNYHQLNMRLYRQVYYDCHFNTQHEDLKEMMCKLTNSSSFKWYKNRMNFIYSNAVMSIVGYIIGLGDRHPENILISLDTFKVIHVDFGDCFDRATLRDTYPEAVPFR